jgi:hypothetical protein
MAGRGEKTSPLAKARGEAAGKPLAGAAENSIGRISWED